MSQLRSKQSTKVPPPENSLATSGSFERNTFLVTALYWLKKERKKMKKSDFWPFQVCLFKMVTATLPGITTVDWGKSFKLLWVLLNASICYPAMILP